MTVETAHAALPAEGPDILALLSARVVLRAGSVALVLGTVLTAINQYDALFGTAPLDLMSLVLVFATPFVVVVISQLLGIRQALIDAGGRRRRTEVSFRQTVMAHGIPLRAFLLGLAVGTVNTSIVAAVLLQVGAGLADLPFVLIAQAYILPMAFSLLSQGLSYRRALALEAPAG